jgi:hypothetical protein
MLKAARRPTEIESVGKVRGNVIHIDSIEADALIEIRKSANIRHFERGDTFSVLT